MSAPETDETQAGESSGCGQACATDAGTARDAGWHQAASRARLLSWLSLAYMTAEGMVAIVAAVLASSVALLGFGLDSAIEGLASVIVIWRFTGTRTLSQTAEARAQRSRSSCSPPTSPTTPSPPWPPATTPGPAGWVSACRFPH